MQNGILSFVMNLDKHLASLAEAYPGWIYALLFLVLFAETGLVVMGMLPGDSLIFASGALAASHGILDIQFVLPLFIAAAFAGDQANYLIGKWVGDKPFKGGRFLLNRKNLHRGKRFYASHGGEAVIMGRFIPVLRSVMPLSAAISGMSWPRFLLFSLPGAALWAATFCMLGFFLGNLSWVQGRFSIVLVGVILVSLLPGLVQFLVEKHAAHGRGHAHRHGARRRRGGGRHALGS